MHDWITCTINYYEMNKECFVYSMKSNGWIKFISNNNLIIIILNDANYYSISNLFNLFIMFFGTLKTFAGKLLFGNSMNFMLLMNEEIYIK